MVRAFITKGECFLKMSVLSSIAKMAGGNFSAGRTEITNTVKSLGIGDLANFGFTGYMALDTYTTERREGNSFMGAVGQTIMDTALATTLGILPYMGLQLATSLPSMAVDAYKFQRNFRRRLGAEQRQRAFQNAQFQDTQQTFTMRQAAMAISQRSRYNTQQAMLGNEAQYMLK